MLKKMRLVKSSVVAVASFVLFACAAPEQKQPISEPEKQAASEYVLQHAYKVQTVAQFCQRLSSVATAKARQIERDWQTANWGYVAVANQALAQQYQIATRSYGELAALYRPVQLYMQANSELEPELMPMKRDFSARDQRCLRLLNNLIEREPSYLQNPQHGAALSVLAQQYTQAQQPFAVLLEYKRDYNPSKSLLGDNVFRAQGLILQQCPQADSYTLEHKGHNNTVLGRCQNGRLLAASCDIVACRLVK